MFYLCCIWISVVICIWLLVLGVKVSIASCSSVKSALSLHWHSLSLYLYCICTVFALYFNYIIIYWILHLIHFAWVRHLCCVCCSSNSTILALSLAVFHQICIFNHSVTFQSFCDFSSSSSDHLAIAINMDWLYFQWLLQFVFWSLLPLWTALQRILTRVGRMQLGCWS